jgi:N-acetylmuramoyl-L-alanine amidase
MKIGIDPGHNCPFDIGAVGLAKEDDLTKAVGLATITLLKSKGHQVTNCLPSTAISTRDALQKRVNKAEAADVDLFVSIHFNKFNGSARGSEVFYGSPTSKKIAQKVLTEFVELGFADRGVKDGSHLYVVRRTTMPAILIECCFCDSTIDMNLYNSLGVDRIAKAIVDGLV